MADNVNSGSGLDIKKVVSVIVSHFLGICHSQKRHSGLYILSSIVMESSLIFNPKGNKHVASNPACPDSSLEAFDANIMLQAIALLQMLQM